MSVARIFNLSLHRSGTQSFQAFCNVNGTNCFHWPGIGFDHLSKPSLNEITPDTVWTLYNFIIKSQPYTAFSDLPVPILYPNLLESYQDAGFFLMLRSPSAWVKSVRSHTGHRTLDVLEQLLYQRICDRLVESTNDLSDGDLEQGYMRHAQDVTNACSGKNARFAVFSLTDTNLGEKLGRFMKLTAPDSFPQVDDTKRDVDETADSFKTGEWE